MGNGGQPPTLTDVNINDQASCSEYFDLDTQKWIESHIKIDDIELLFIATSATAKKRHVC